MSDELIIQTWVKDWDIEGVVYELSDGNNLGWAVEMTKRDYEFVTDAMENYYRAQILLADLYDAAWQRVLTERSAAAQDDNQQGDDGQRADHHPQ